MKKKIGIIGITGRMGRALAEVVQPSQNYELGIGFDSTTNSTLNEVLNANDYIVDFSSAKLIEAVIEAVIKEPKPLVLCSTGWDKNKLALKLKDVAKNVPVIIAPNTSLGACVQKHLTAVIAKILSDEYDIDIIEHHHKGKLDAPSGTALALADSIKEAKRAQNIEYQSCTSQSRRADHCITLSSLRSGNVPGKHYVSFTSPDEMIAIEHVAFNRNLFAKGAMMAVQWLDSRKPSPAMYTMADVLELPR